MTRETYKKRPLDASAEMDSLTISHSNDDLRKDITYPNEVASSLINYHKVRAKKVYPPIKDVESYKRRVNNLLACRFTIWDSPFGCPPCVHDLCRFGTIPTEDEMEDLLKSYPFLDDDKKKK